VNRSWDLGAGQYFSNWRLEGDVFLRSEGSIPTVGKSDTSVPLGPVSAYNSQRAGTRDLTVSVKSYNVTFFQGQGNHTKGGPIRQRRVEKVQWRVNGGLTWTDGIPR
jgi:hypothetical protein